VPSFNFIAIFNVDFPFFVAKEMRKKHFYFVLLRMMKDIIDCNEFHCDFYQKNESEFSVLELPIFWDSAFLIEIESIVDCRVITCNAAFAADRNHVERCQFLWKCEKDKIETEFDVFREILTMSGGSRWKIVSSSSQTKSNGHVQIEFDKSVRIIALTDFCDRDSWTEVTFSSRTDLREISGFRRCSALCRIVIPSSVEKIGAFGFSGCTSLNDIIFSSDSHLREISGFQECTLLYGIKIPSSVELIGSGGFVGCTSLYQVIFSSDSHLREISGFQKCRLLDRIEIPSSVEVIGNHGFFSRGSLRIVILRPGCRMKANEGLQNVHPFLFYRYDDLKKFRGHVHLGIEGREVL
jgi:hypothetical protein